MAEDTLKNNPKNATDASSETQKSEAKSKKKAAPKTKKSARAKKDSKDSAVPKSPKEGRFLLIVESPSKAKTIQKYLKGEGFVVKASVGHIKDLPKSKLGVDVDKDFAPVYETIPAKQKVLAELHAYAEDAPIIYLGPDPDREGEAIAWHIAEAMPSKGKKVYRVLFNAITKQAVKEALANPVELNEDKFNAQQARRVLDRLVGYKLSPLLWDKVRRGLSAGRVQSVAVRLIVDRERSIGEFIPEEYWSIAGNFRSTNNISLGEFRAKFAKLNGEDPVLGNESTVRALLSAMKPLPFTVTKVLTRERQRKPSAPFITSKLQQEAANKLGFSAKKTMTLAQQLYEGKDLGELGQTGLVTYIRTDSVRTTPEAMAEVREYISEAYGKNTLPAEPNIYKTKKSAQDAHEAIRPASLKLLPKTVQPYLDADTFKLYELIWNRFIASQMLPAIYDQKVIELSAKEKDTYLFRLTGSKIKVQGFTAVYVETRDEAPKKKTSDDATEGSGNEEDDLAFDLPDLAEGDQAKVLEFFPEQHFTQPPPRFSDASLIKELEELGIGRPSTYAAIISNIQDREYIEKRATRFYPSELGVVVTDLLLKSFPEVMDPQFTADMEEKLDLIEEGKSDWVQVLREFYKPFEKSLEVAKIKMKDIKRLEIPTEHKCEKCSAILMIKWGKQGSFLACSNYPDCKFTQEFKKDEEGKIIPLAREVSDEKCVKCGKEMLVRNGKFGKFLACSDYPDCKSTKVITTGIKCPLCKEGELAKKASRYNRPFYGCTAYPNCTYALWDKPIPVGCPTCKWPIMAEKITKREGAYLKCPQKECGHKEPLPEGHILEEGAALTAVNPGMTKVAV